MSDPKVVTIDFNVDDQWQDIQCFLERASSIISLKNRDSWVLDCSECRYLGPDAVVLIAGLWDRDKRQGLHPRVILPEEPKKLAAFCTFSGLNHHVNKGERPKDHEQSETVPLQLMYEPRADAHRRVLKLVRDHFPELSEDAEIALGVAINEVVQNVCDHADSPIGALMAARFFQNKHDVRVAILDLGLGIPRTLSRAYPKARDPEQALRLVVKGNATSGSKANNMGLGISNLVTQVQRRHGELLLLSSGAVADLGSDRVMRYHPAPVDFPGTAVFFRMTVDDDDS